ncbi:MAG: hypothetical protein JO112_13155, partial [Planctomycetes bacterium]|nr:hypothetical protein [Planctomycetota bacterium]
MPTNTSWSSPLTAALPPPPGVIDYHGYAALICTFDDSTWIRMGRPSPMFVPSRFTSICRDYHSRIDRNRTAWCESQHLNPAKFTFPSYLYNPACYLTFGQTDSIGLVLIDDIDAMMEITADIRSPVEQVHLAYAPTLASLGLTSSPWFAELHEMFDAPPGQANGLEILPGNHQIQQTAPLLMWTKLKVNGVAMVGEGLLFQQAAYRAIAERILLVVSGLERHAGEPPQGPKQPLYSTADLDPQHLKFVFLDPQGVEEISVLIYTRNYSVGVSILAAIRCLTFANIFGADPRLKKQLSVSPTHQQIIAACRKGSGTAQASVEDLSDNHLLSKTYTTLGVAYQAFNKPESSGCTGFVLAYPQCDVNPGHLGEVEARLLDLLSPVAPTGTFTRQSPAAHVLGSGADIHRFLVGRHDYLLELHPQAANVPIQGLSVVGFFQLMRGLYERVGCVNARGEQETGLLDISTAIVVPFPRILLPDGEDFLLRKVGKRHLSLMPLLERIRHSVFGESTSGQSAPGTLLKAHQLSNALRELCLPSLLRRTIRYLYQDFAHCLSDPFLFEAVLDLFDIFFTLDHLFCEVLPQAQREDLEGRGERSLFTAGDLDELEGLLSALHNALTHRVAFCMPHSEVRDMAVDFRGGLNRLVAAADVPLKCGMGVLRRLIPAKVGTAAGKGPGTSTIPFNAPPRNTVGAVTRISFNPIPFLSSLSLGQKYGVWLGYIDMDVAHIINPLAYPMYVHEVSHLILRSLPTWPEWLKAAEEIVLKDRPSASEEREWTARVNLEEIAVEMLTYLFVFAPDFGLFQKYLIVRFNSYPAVSGVTTDKVLARFAEILLRIFFVTDPFVLAPSTDWNTCSELGLTY